MNEFEKALAERIKVILNKNEELTESDLFLINLYERKSTRLSISKILESCEKIVNFLNKNEKGDK